MAPPQMAPLEHAFQLLSSQVQVGKQPGPEAVLRDTAGTMPPHPQTVAPTVAPTVEDASSMAPEVDVESSATAAP